MVIDNSADFAAERGASIFKLAFAQLLLPGIFIASFSLSANAQSDPEDSDGESRRLDALVIDSETENLAEGADTGLSIDSVSTAPFANTTSDLKDVVKKTPGVVVRETGGLGSSFDLSLNGLSGRQVRFFLDGIPTENFGSALTLNNFPVSLVERIDVYKGVVPVSLGADALGGAIDIITAPRNETLVDASISAGSFGTLRAALVAQLAGSRGTFLRLNSFINHSDNDYEMRDVPLEDDLGNRIGVTDARRFHDAYSSAMLNLRGGIAGRGSVEELSLGVTVAGNTDEEQHPDTSINEVYGEVESDNETALASLVWKQSIGLTDVKAYLLGGQVVDTTYDTASRDYDWLGDFTPAADPSAGEIGTRSIFELTDRVVRASVGVSRPVGELSTLSGNLSINQLDRSGNDRIDANNTSFTSPNSLDKSVLGFAWERDSLAERLRTTIFLKRYQYDAQIIASQFVDNRFEEVRTVASHEATGYGASAAFDLSPNVIMSLSYEHAFRLPEPDETLGSGKYIRPNPELVPEQSNNLNLAVDYRSRGVAHTIDLRTALFRRDATDFIRYVPDQLVFGIYENLASVRVQGVELSADWQAESSWFAQSALTWQSLTDETRTDSNGLANSNFGSRLPNEPYLFGNIRAGREFLLPNSAQVSASWSVNYVHAFFLNWENSGSEDAKFDIPQQLTHDIDLEYSLASRAWSASLSIRNLFDEDVFDNFAIQKPGRASYLKIRYVY